MRLTENQSLMEELYGLILLVHFCVPVYNLQQSGDVKFTLHALWAVSTYFVRHRAHF